MAIGVIIGTMAVARAKAARTSSNTQWARKSWVAAAESRRDPAAGSALGVAGAVAVIEGSLLVMTLIPRLGPIRLLRPHQRRGHQASASMSTGRGPAEAVPTIQSDGDGVAT